MFISKDDITMISRVKKAIGKMITIFAAIDDTTFGIYKIPYPTLSFSIFACHHYQLPVMDKHHKKNLLSTAQLKYLRRLLNIPHSTSNSII